MDFVNQKYNFSLVFTTFFLLPFCIKNYLYVNLEIPLIKSHLNKQLLALKNDISLFVILYLQLICANKSEKESNFLSSL